MLTIERRQDALLQKQQRLAQQSEGMQRRTGSGNRRWLSSLTAVAGGYLSIGAAIGVATKALAAMNQERQRAAQAKTTAEEAMGRLAQLVGTKEELRHVRGEALRSVYEEGMPIEQAAALQHFLTSAGKGETRGQYARLYGMADPAAMANAVATLQSAMGKRETGLDRQVLDKLFRASAATKTDVAEIAMTAAGTGKIASQEKVTDEELLAVAAVLARGEVTPEEARTKIRGLLVSARRHGISTEGGLVATAERVFAIHEKTGKPLIKILGRMQGVEGAIGIMKDRAEIVSLRRELVAVDAAAAAGTGDYTGVRVGLYREAAGDARLARIQTARRHLAEHRLAGDEFRRQQIMDEWAAEDVKRGGLPMTRYFREQWLKGYRWLGFSPESMQRLVDRMEAQDRGEWQEGFVGEAGEWLLPRITPSPTGTPLSGPGQVYNVPIPGNTGIDVTVTDRRQPPRNAHNE